MTMRCTVFQRARGFTLIELLVAVSIFLLILLGVYELFDTNRQNYVSGTRKVDIQQNARVASDEIAREIRMAGYFPENFPTPPGCSPASCANPTNPLVNPQPIQVAQNTGLAIFGDADGSGVSSIFLYCLSGTTVMRVKTTLTGGAVTGPAAAYTCSNGNTLAANIATLTFTYYDGTNTPIPNPPTAPYTLDNAGMGQVPSFASTAQRGAVRVVVITLTATETVPGPGEQPQSFTLTSTIRLRNLT